MDIIKSSYRNALFILLAIGYIFTSCRSKESRKEQTGTEFTMDMVEVGEMAFHLDSLTAPFSEAYSYMDYGDEGDYLYFLNRKSNKIYQYDCQTGQIHHTITYEREGSNGVGGIRGLQVTGLDSIYVLDDFEHRLSLINRSGEKLDSWVVNDVGEFSETNLIPYAILLSNTNPMAITGGSFYLTGFTLGEREFENEHNRPVVLRYAIVDGKTEYMVSYPSIYQGKNWGGNLYRYIYSCYNPEENTMVLSFPASDELVVLDLNLGSTRSYYAGSSLFDEVSPLPYKKGVELEDEIVYKYFATHPSYSSVIYDPYRELYYRISDIPIAENLYDPNTKKGKVKPFSILVLDKDFNIIGETRLPHLSHSRLEFFVSKEGLNLKKNQKNEDLLIFTTFSPKSLD